MANHLVPCAFKCLQPLFMLLAISVVSHTVRATNLGVEHANISYYWAMYVCFSRHLTTLFPVFVHRVDGNVWMMGLITNLSIASSHKIYQFLVYPKGAWVMTFQNLWFNKQNKFCSHRVNRDFTSVDQYWSKVCG